MGSIWGVVVGAIVVSELNSYLLPKVLNDVPSKVGLDFDLSSIASGIYGLLLVLAMLLRPAGLLPPAAARAARPRSVGRLSGRRARRRSGGPEASAAS
jgi:ABC-type branched-subunit amino acid transport system permease subunit